MPVLLLAGCGAGDLDLLCDVERPSLFRIAHADGSFSEGPFNCDLDPPIVNGDAVDIEVKFTAVTSHAVLALKVRAPNRTWSVEAEEIGGDGAAVSLEVHDPRYETRLEDQTSTSGTATLEADRWPVEEGEQGRIKATLLGTLEDTSTVEATLDFSLYVIPGTIL